MMDAMLAVAVPASEAATVVAGASRDTIDGWRPPTVPYGYDALVACQYDNGWELDFVNERTRSFASEDVKDLDIAWPWPAGFEPQASDWKRLGIDVIDFR